MVNTIIPGASDKLLTMGDLYIATNITDFTTIPTLTATNQDTVRAALEAYTYESVGHIKSFKVSHAQDNETVIRAGNCGVGELARYYDKTPSITFTWLNVNNRVMFDRFLGLDRLSVAGTLVTGATQIIASGYTIGQFYPISNQNGDGSAISITSIVGSIGGSLVLNTDYSVTKVNGIYGITLISTAKTSNTAQTHTITYNYTPSAYTLDGYNVAKNAGQFVLCKFVSCKNAIDNSNGIQDTIYFWKFIVNKEIVEDYIDTADTEFAGTEMSLVGGTGGGYLKKKATVAL